MSQMDMQQNPLTKEDMLIELTTPEWKPANGLAIGSLRPMMTGLDLEGIILQSRTFFFLNTHEVSVVGNINEIYHFTLADRTGSISLWLWGDMGRAIKPMQIVRISGAYTKLYRNNISVYIKRDGGRLQRTGSFRMLFAKEPNMSEYEWVEEPEASQHYLPVKAGMAKTYQRLFNQPQQQPQLIQQTQQQPNALSLHPMQMHMQPSMPQQQVAFAQGHPGMPMNRMTPMSMVAHGYPQHQQQPMPQQMNPYMQLQQAQPPPQNMNLIKEQLVEQVRVLLAQKNGRSLDPHEQVLVQQVQQLLSVPTPPNPFLMQPSMQSTLQPSVPWMKAGVQQEPQYLPDSESPGSSSSLSVNEGPSLNQQSQPPPSKKRKEDSNETGVTTGAQSAGRGGRGGQRGQRGHRGRGTRGHRGRGGQARGAAAKTNSRTSHGYADLDYTASGGGDDFVDYGD